MNILDFVQRCEFVEASDVFKDCQEAWTCFADSEPDCSWGNNNRTMVTPNTIIESLEEAHFEDEPNLEKEIDVVIKRLKELGQMYVDLEN